MAPERAPISQAPRRFSHTQGEHEHGAVPRQAPLRRRLPHPGDPRRPPRPAPAGEARGLPGPGDGAALGGNGGPRRRLPLRRGAEMLPPVVHLPGRHRHRHARPGPRQSSQGGARVPHLLRRVRRRPPLGTSGPGHHRPGEVSRQQHPHPFHAPAGTHRAVPPGGRPRRSRPEAALPHDLPRPGRGGAPGGGLAPDQKLRLHAHSADGIQWTRTPRRQEGPSRLFGVLAYLDEEPRGELRPEARYIL